MKRLIPILLLFTIIPITSYAERPPAPERRKPVRFGKKLIERLNLTDEQVKELRRLQRELRKKNVPLLRKLRTDIVELEDSVLGTRKTKRSTDELVEEITKLRSEIARNRLEFWLKFVDVLSEEQKKVLHQWLRKIGKRMRKRPINPAIFLP